MAPHPEYYDLNIWQRHRSQPLKYDIHTTAPQRQVLMNARLMKYSVKHKFPGYYQFTAPSRKNVSLNKCHFNTSTSLM